MTLESDEVDGRYHIAAYISGLDLRRVLKEDDLFVVVNRNGNIRSTGRGEQGLYYKGTKHASELVLRIEDQVPMLLGSGVQHDDLLLAVDLTNPDLPGVPYGTIHVGRSSFPHQGAYLERIVIANHGPAELSLELSLAFDADFADIFEVRGMRRERRGERLPSEVSGARVRLSYCGLDDVVRSTRLELAPAPTRLSANEARFGLYLPRRGTESVYLRIVPEQGAAQGDGRPASFEAATFETAMEEREERIRRSCGQQCQLRTSNQVLDSAIDRARSDLEMLLTRTPQGLYPYAGLPWYSTPFGRDGLWAALQTLWVAPDISAGVLEFLSAHQATKSDPEADAEPGKILHELRDGEMAALREVPFGCYYGSIDSTPLYLMLAWRYFEATADRERIERLWPSLLRAMEWIDVHGDRDGDGFVEYGRHAEDGLVQQGWKDSNDSVFHRDGALAEGPIALCEVQGYVYDAKLGLSRMARSLGHEELATRWEQAAHELRERFDAAFWCEELGTYALALDGAKRPCRVKTSNAAHCLFTRIARPERRAALARTLMAPEMFSGFGIRTLASDEQCFNPMSYHNGSIWPHDTSIAASGLAAAGFGAEAERLLEALFDAASFFELHRLPELFCGFPRRPEQPPIQYPVACSPQAWASASIFMLLEAVLGLRVDGLAHRVTFHHPSLPPFIEELQIENLRVGRDSVGLRLHRHPEDVGILVTSSTGEVEVVVVK